MESRLVVARDALGVLDVAKKLQCKAALSWCIAKYPNCGVVDKATHVIHFHEHMITFYNWWHLNKSYGLEQVGVAPWVCDAPASIFITASQMTTAMDCLCSRKIHILNPNPRCDGIQRWRLWEAIRSWEQRPPLWKRLQSNLLTLFTCVVIAGTVICEPGSESSPDTKSTVSLTLNWKASRTMRDTYVCCL